VGEQSWWASYSYMKSNDETSCNCFKGGGEVYGGEDCGDNLTNVQCKVIQNCHSESPLYNKYILIKMGGMIVQRIPVNFVPRSPIITILH
jgi:hypothetical protein